MAYTLLAYITILDLLQLLHPALPRVACCDAVGCPTLCSCAVCRVDFIEKKIKTFLDVGLLSGNKKLLWVNPDCGLKTREWSQVGAMLLTLPCLPKACNALALPSLQAVGPVTNTFLLAL